MTDDEADRLLARLSNINSLRAVYDVLSDLARHETLERDALPFQHARLVLQDFAWRLEGLRPDPDDSLGHWAAVAQEVVPHIRDTIEAYRARDDQGWFEALRRLSQSWTTVRGRLL